MRSLCSLPGGAAVISQGMEDTVQVEDTARMRSLCSLPGGAAVISQGMEDTVHCTGRGHGAHAQSLFAARWRSCDQPGDGGFCTGLIPKNNIFFLLLSFFTFICNFSNYFLLFSFHLCFYFFLLN